MKEEQLNALRQQDNALLEALRQDEDGATEAGGQEKKALAVGGCRLRRRIYHRQYHAAKSLNAKPIPAKSLTPNPSRKGEGSGYF